MPQGALAAERNTLQAIVKVIAPSAFAQAFAHGSKRGVLALPFCATRCPSNPHRPRPPPPPPHASAPPPRPAPPPRCPAADLSSFLLALSGLLAATVPGPQWSSDAARPAAAAKPAAARPSS